MGDVCGAQFQPSGLEFVPESLCLTVVHEATIKSIQQNIIGGCIICPVPVSYTHLDVYKRQPLSTLPFA